MKKLVSRLAALGLSLSLLCSPALAALDGAPKYKGTTNFDFIMEYIDGYALNAEGRDVLRDYFNKLLQEHPEEFVAVVNDIVSSLDSHSMYLSADEYASSFGTTLAAYAGIGVTLRLMDDGSVRLTDVNRYGPAYEAGLRMGDVLTMVDNQPLLGETLTNVSNLLRGDVGVPVDVTVRRGNQELKFVVPRTAVRTEFVNHYTISPGVEYIDVRAMASQQDADEFLKVWGSLPAKGIRAVIIDLRDNGGGLISMAQSIIEAVAPDAGKKYLTLRFRKDGGGEQEFYTPGGGPRMNKIMILVNGGTASAAEILSGSLSDMGYATLLGTQTYGKGEGQYHFQMPDGSMLILTSVEIKLPSRGAYEGKPLLPNLNIGLNGTHTPAYRLQPLDGRQAVGRDSDASQVAALIERLRVLGYLASDTDVFDDTVLEALHAFQKENALPQADAATPDAIAVLEGQAELAAEKLGGFDLQLSTAVEQCKLALEKPPLYTLGADGTWTNKPA